MRTNLKVAVAGFALAGAISGWAGSQSFDFKDAKGVNNAVFKLDAPLESINGTATGVSGSVVYDPANPASLQGKIVFDAKTLHVPNPMMKEHLHGEQWMDVAKYPEITFEAIRVSGVKASGDTVTADVVGKLTLRGVAREITVPVKLTYLKDKLSDRTMGRMKGDLLVVRTAFTINRSDYGINPSAPKDKVSEQIELVLSLAGAAPAP
jgi:polyisoprenoid-binding protein YceI